MGLFTNFLSQRKSSSSASEKAKEVRNTRNKEAQEKNTTDNRLEQDRYRSELADNNRRENLRIEEERNWLIQEESDRRSGR